MNMYMHIRICVGVLVCGVLCVSDKRNEPEGPEWERVHVFVCVHSCQTHFVGIVCVHVAWLCISVQIVFADLQ